PGVEGDPCDDGNPCTENDMIMPFCDCQGTNVYCESTDPCIDLRCNSVTGICTPITQPDSDGDGLCDPVDNCPDRPGVEGDPCDDGDPCTSADLITSSCECHGSPVFCESTDPCTHAECDPATGGCVTLIGPDIDDDGVCYPADPCPLLAGGPGDPCDDGNACTWFDHITADCQCFGQPMPCEDDDPCTLNTCHATTGCVFPPGPDTDGDGICDAVDDCPMRAGMVGTMCDDGSACTIADEIDANCICTGTPAVCDDSDPCTMDGCLPASGCTHVPIPDSDGDGFCDAVQYCAPCDDSDPCTFDLCDVEGDCFHTSIPDPDGDGLCPDGCPFLSGSYGGTCDDGDACTTGDVILGYCICRGVAVDCDDANPCTVDGCDGTGCVHSPAIDTDGDGICDGVDTCPLLSGNVGDPCDDGIACTVGDHISFNCQCTGFPTACDDASLCTFSLCGSGGCVPVTLPDTDGDGTCDFTDICPFHPQGDGDPCDDGDPCTIGDLFRIVDCTCVGDPINCDDEDPCTVDACSGGTCSHTPLPDFDGDGTCDTHDVCPFDPHDDLDPCDDGDPCTIGDNFRIVDCTCSGEPIDCD
ncbi:MAG: hypothetical protein KA791_05245, partial [Flavobacteriales bacterium]|nr:hypothetical protein [Flavobacteriales bacterium]